jgi:hypothetical protein
MKQTLKYIYSHCPTHLREKLLAYFPAGYASSSSSSSTSGTKNTTGLLISERLINTPVELIVPLHQALLDDIHWAVKSDKNEV